MHGRLFESGHPKPSAGTTNIGGQREYMRTTSSRMLFGLAWYDWLRVLETLL